METFFDTSPDEFRWAVGIEDTFIPHARLGERPLEEYALMQHYRYWRSDLDLAAAAGAKMIRWGVPWYKVQPKPNKWHWAWVDDVLDYMVNVLRLTPILDLMHYGTPLWLKDSFANPQYPALVARYAAEFARRYGKWVKLYTPLNEPLVNAMMCGSTGQWPPYLKGRSGEIRLMMALVKGMVMTAEAIRSVQSDATLVWVEALTLHRTLDAALVDEVERRDAMQYLAHDLVTGRVDNGHALYPLLLRHGAGLKDLRWLQNNPVTLDVFGCNFYPWSAYELLRRPDGQIRAVHPPRNGALLAQVLKAAYDHYQVPLIVTETSAREGVAGRTAWLQETLGAVKQVRSQGVPVVGYTWFPLFTMVDWKYRHRRGSLQTYLLDLGLYEVTCEKDGSMPRHPTSLVAAYHACTQKSLETIGEYRSAGFEFTLKRQTSNVKREA